MHTSCTQVGLVSKSEHVCARAAAAISDSTREHASAVPRGAASFWQVDSNTEHQLMTQALTDGQDMSAWGTLRAIRKMEEMHSMATLLDTADGVMSELNASQMAAHADSSRLTDAAAAALRMASVCHLRPPINRWASRTNSQAAASKKFG